MGDRTLAIDTATTACSAALFQDGKCIASDYEEIGRGHAEKLIPMIAALPEKGQANEIWVNCGPGSFTGVRIGLSAAKALALAWNANLKGYGCLDLIAAQALAAFKQPQPMYVAMTGGHGEFFVQNFSASGDAVDELQSLPPSEAKKKAKTDLVFGSAADELFGLENQTPSIPKLPNAASSYLLNYNSWQIPAKPVYGRAADAKPAIAASAS